MDDEAKTKISFDLTHLTYVTYRGRNNFKHEIRKSKRESFEF